MQSSNAIQHNAVQCNAVHVSPSSRTATLLQLSLHLISLHNIIGCCITLEIVEYVVDWVSLELSHKCC